MSWTSIADRIHKIEYSTYESIFEFEFVIILFDIESGLNKGVHYFMV